MDDMQKLVQTLGFNRVKFDESIKDYTYMKVGGLADFLYEARSKEDLVLAVKTARELEIPFTILGLGANVLVSDKGIRGLLIVNKAHKIRFLANDYFEVESGVPMPVLIRETSDMGYSGMERMIKVPGTVGGAIYMNAGHTREKQFFGDLVASVEVLNGSNEIKKIMHKECEFAYRSSRFQQTQEIILSALLHLKKVDRSVIEENVKNILLYKINQPAGPSVGSTFRNPEGDFAGRLIDECGLKGKRVGGAKISEKHANFILNTGNATANEVKQLIELMRSKVKSKHGVDLKEEVIYLGDWNV